MTATPTFEFERVDIPVRSGYRKRSARYAAIQAVAADPARAVVVRLDQTGCASIGSLATGLVLAAKEQGLRVWTKRGEDSVTVWLREGK